MTNRKISSPPTTEVATSTLGGEGFFPQSLPLLGGDVNKVDRGVMNKIIKFTNFTNNQQDQK